MSEPPRAPLPLRVAIAPVALVTATAGAAFAMLLARDGSDPAEPFLVVLFVVLFGWIGFWFWISALGTLRVWQARHELGALRDVSELLAESELPPTAVVVPIHNEAVESVFARIDAMLESMTDTGHESFDFFVLSDTTEPDLWLREELAFAGLRRKHARGPHLYYRHRPNKFRKKSGNIADFCERWGNRYRYMIVLDADSVMDGRTMLELVRRMEYVPGLGILQAPSLPAMRDSLYARLQQFSSSVYGTPLFAGLSYCFQDHGTFWGHNAIIRVSAFMRHCGLPGLPGRPPFGGPILSHDFVEAALMERAGYGVRLAWDLGGSYEQCPVSLSASAQRDRRWCQGNLQHLRLVFSPTFSRQSRVHFAVGVLFYATSAFWGLFVVLQYLMTSRVSRHSVLGATDAGLTAPSLALLGTTLVFLVAAKLFGLSLLLTDRARSAAHGGPLRIWASAAIEVVVSILAAPIQMTSQVTALASVLLGISVDWGSAERDETRSPWRDAMRAHGSQSVLGAAIGLLTFYTSRSSFAWLAPIWAGLLAAVPLAAILGSRAFGIALRRRGILLTPPEMGKVPILDRVAELSRPRPTAELDFARRFGRMVRDPWLNTLHVALLDAAGTRARPRHVLEPLVRRAIEEGPASLSPSDALAVLSDAWAMRTLHEESLF